MNQETHLAKIKLIEEKFPVNSCKYRSIHVWPAIRYLLLLGFKNGFSGQVVGVPPASRKLSLKERIVQSYIAFRHFQKFSKKRTAVSEQLKNTDILIFSRLSEHADVVEGKKYNRLVDPFVEYFKKESRSVVKLEIGKPEATNRYFNPLLLDDEDFAIHKRSRALLAGPAAEPRDLQKLLDDVYSGNNIRITAGDLMSVLDKCCYYRDLFLQVFEGCRPRVVFVTAYYAPDTFGLILACRKLGITTVDIQHGKQGKYHFMYSHFTKVPAEGYDLLPDYFWNWGKESADNISRWMPFESRHKTIVGGNLWMMRWKQNKGADKPEDQLFFERAAKYKRIILFSLQPIANNNFPDFVIKTIKNTKDDCFWMLRLHPGMRKDVFPLLDKILSECPNAEKENSSSLPLFRLLEAADVHVTCWSSVAFEALSFGLHTILIHAEALSLYKEDIEKGVFSFCDDASAFRTKLLEGKKDSTSDYIVYDLESLQNAMAVIGRS